VNRKIQAGFVRHKVISEFSPFKVLKMIRIFLALMLLASAASAQTDILITSKADTLYGKLRILSYDQIDRIQLDSDKKREMFTALEVLAITKDGVQYKPLKFDNKIVMMQLLKPGYLSLYAFRLPDQSTYDGRFLVKLDGSTLELPNLGFKKILSTYLSDCDTVVNQIKRGSLAKKDLDKIIDIYNACISAKKNAPAAPVIAAPVLVSNEKTAAIESFINKVEQEDFASKKDALDLLRDIQMKVGKNEAVSNYLSEGLKSYLSDVPSLAKDLDKLLALLKN